MATSTRSDRPTDWARTFRFLFATTPTALMRMIRKRVSLGPIVELRIAGRRTGIERSVLVVRVRVDGITYVGHPNGLIGHWPRNVVAAGTATLVERDGQAQTMRAIQLRPGPERDRVIDAHARVQVLPARLLYRAAREHVRSTGTFFRLEPIVI